MKKLILTVCAATLAVLTGCKSIPETGTMYTTSYAIGVATGLVCNQTKIDDESRNAIIDIVNKVSACVPETNQTFEASWTPIAKAHTEELVKSGKLTEKQGELVLAAFSVVVKGVDYIFEERYPAAKPYKELTVAAIDGFSNGFLLVFKPANGTDDASRSVYEYDEDAYDWLTKQTK